MAIRSNAELTDSFVQATIKKEHFPNQLTVVPRDGDKVTVGGEDLAWHAIETTRYNVNLYHFAYALGKPTYNVVFWAVTTVNCPEEMPNVRLAVGSNAASIWWVNGEEVMLLLDQLKIRHCGLSCPMVTTDAFHTYRIVIHGEDLRVYVDGELRLDAAGRFTHPAPNGRSGVAFGGANSPNVGIILCGGIWLEGGERMGVDLTEAIRWFVSNKKTWEVHFRNVSSPLPRFLETFPDNGYYDMYKAMKALVDAGYGGIVHLDHALEMVGAPYTYQAYAVGYMKACLQRALAEAKKA